MAVEPDLVLGERQGVPARDTQLLAHDVDAGDEFGHGMLNLHACVDLEKRVVASDGIDHELDSGRAHVVERAAQFHGRPMQLCPHGGVDRQGGSLFDDLLITPLGRAVTLTKMHHVAMRVGEDLHLDMAGTGDEPLDVQPAVAERLQRLVARRGEGGVEVIDLIDQHHAAASTAGGRLEQHRQPD
ncbi:unannotated protein [freshwater metagenome]|uniref:Unannotated protein n=1 Tax=freshwater metagenome TaxID=449393 RepID=A0A6J7PNJ2_9ZZZZ